MLLESPPFDAARTHLHLAYEHLNLARDLLTRSDPEYRAAAAHIAGTCYDALAAVTSWHQVNLPLEADVQEHALHAIGLVPRLGWPAHRVLLILPGLRTAGSKARLNERDHARIETGWYTARDLYHTVLDELPDAVSGGFEAPVPSLWPERQTETTALEPTESSSRAGAPVPA